MPKKIGPDRIAGITLAVLLMSACAGVPKKEQAIVFDTAAEKLQGSSPRVAPPAPQDASQTEAPPEDRLVYFQESPARPKRLNVPGELGDKKVSAQFVNAPAADVTKTMIGEVLGKTVAIANGVSGTITLSAPEPIPARDALAALEAVLAESGLALVEVDDQFLLTTLQAAGQRAIKLNAPETPIGFGAVVEPLRHSAPADVIALVQPLVSSRLTITPDEKRMSLLLKGPQSDIEAALAAIRTFDNPRLADRVTGMFKLHYADPDSLRAEILGVLGSRDAAASGAIDLIAIPRLSLLFVTTRTRSGFEEIRAWIDRLDQPSAGGERRVQYYSVKNASAEALAEQLGALFGGAALRRDAAEPAAESPPRDPAARLTAFDPNALSFSVDAANNALIMRATDGEFREVRALLEKMDVLPAQVLIEATIAEVTLNDEIGYGVRWFFENAESRVSFPGFAPGGEDDNNPATSLLRFPAVVPGLNYSFAANNVSAALDLLNSVTDVSVLSSPSIVVLNNQAAQLQVGDEVPIVTQQAQSTIDPDAPLVSTLQLRETGVILNVKPRISASDVVVLEIDQEVSDVAPTTTSGIDSPTIQQRKFSSTVAVADNGTIALAGLVRETFTDRESGVPILKNIPGLGLAFKSRDVSKRRTELVIFLTPRIIRNADEANETIRFIREKMRYLGEPQS